ncbi:MAG TPA: glycosyl hydrolase, partial [Verrucomicrobiales bacterium]|nr:glycosyl hydrolase [Verrucomicrobiales bacterium]
DAAQAAIAPGQQAMLASDCFNCHAINEKVVGPALLDIAQRYRYQPEALPQSVQRVLKGSAGVWGEIPMLAHAELAEQQVESMVQWIYSLKPSALASNTQRGLQGTLDLGEMSVGKPWILKATYVDFGWESVAPLAASATIQLRHRRIEAEHCSDYQGLRILGNKLGAIEHGSYARFRSIPLHDVGKITVRVASGGAGGQIIVREGSPDGPVVTSFEVTPTGGYDQFVEKTSPPLDRNGRRDLFFCFVNPGKGGLMDVDWVECHP